MNNRNCVNNNIKQYNNISMKSPFYPTKCIDCGINNRFICSECINYDFSLCRNCHQAFIHGGFSDNNNNMNCSNTSCNQNCENKNQCNQNIDNSNCSDNGTGFIIGSPNASSCSTSYDSEEFDYGDIATEDFDHYFHHGNSYYDYQFENSQFDFKCFISSNNNCSRLFTCPYLNCLKEGFNEKSLSLHLLECHEEEILLNTYVVCPFCSYRYKDGKFMEHIKENHLNQLNTSNNSSSNIHHHHHHHELNSSNSSESTNDNLVS